MMYFSESGAQSTDTIRQAVTDREQIASEQREFVISRAKNATFLRADRARQKFGRLRACIRTRQLREYEVDARLLIEDPKASLLLSTRVPTSKAGSGKPGEVTLNVIFSIPQKNRKTREAGFLATVVDLEENTILTHHWRDRLTSANDIAAAMQQVKKGLWKWLTA